MNLDSHTPKLPNVNRRKEREYLSHRREILEAAEKVFGARGFFLSTIKEIAEAADFAVGTLYNYFNSKEDLYFTLIDEKAEEVNQILRDQLSEKITAGEKIERMFQRQLRFVEENKDFFRIYISERGRFAWTENELAKKHHNKRIEYIHLVGRIMREGILKGEFKPLDPMDLAHAWVELVNSFFSRWLVNPDPKPLMSKKDAILEIFLRGIQRVEKQNLNRTKRIGKTRKGVV
jgi:TetR/AcrR family transcriptional regulator